MSKKLKNIYIENLAEFDRVSVSFDKNVTYLVGKNGSGKSTIGVEALWIALQGIAEKASTKEMKPVIGERFRFIGPAGPTAKVNIIIHDDKLDCDITIKRKITKSDQSVTFEGPEGIILDQHWINEFFNIFMISPKHFLELSSKDQAIALGINLSIEDAAIKKIKEDFTFLNRSLKDLGAVDEELLSMPSEEKIETAAISRSISEANIHNNEEQKKYLAKEKLKETILLNKQNLEKMKEEFTRLLERTKNMTIEIEKMPDPEYINTEELQKQYDDAVSHNERIAENTSAIEKAQKAKEIKIKIEKNRVDLQKKETIRTNKIVDMKLPFADLTINEEGELMLKKRPLKETYWSTGELAVIIPELMATTNPDFKYVYIQNFSLLDEDNQKHIINQLTKAGFQVVCEVVGSDSDREGHKILMKNIYCKEEEEE